MFVRFQAAFGLGNAWAASAHPTIPSFGRKIESADYCAKWFSGSLKAS
nr:hypothetical protein [uncultured Kingella sp.]